MVRAVLTLFHDYTCPASAVAAFRLQRLADEGWPVDFEGFDALGVAARLPLSLDVIAALDGCRDDAHAEGLMLRRPSGLPPTALAHLVGAVAEDHDLGASWRQTCYRAFWEHDADLADPDVLTDLAGTAGLAPADIARLLGDQPALTALRRRMGRYRREGVGGVPTIHAHGTLIPGLLPLHDLRALAAL